MASQNLVSAVISPELKSSITAKLDGLKTDLGFVITLTPEEKNEYIKVKNVMLPFLDKAYDVVKAHPEIMPSIFDKDEFFNDYQLTKDLFPIANKLEEMAQSLSNTLYAANSDGSSRNLCSRSAEQR